MVHATGGKMGDAQLENGKVCKAVVLLAANLVVQVIFQNPDIGRVIAI